MREDIGAVRFATRFSKTELSSHDLGHLIFLSSASLFLRFLRLLSRICTKLAAIGSFVRNPRSLHDG